MWAPPHITWLGAPIVLCAIAASSDWTRRRIPNAVVAPLALLGILHAGTDGGWPAAAQAALVGALAVTLLFLPFAAGFVGAGDVKLLAAAATWLGLAWSGWLLLVSAVAGGVLSAAAYLAASTGERASVRANLAGLALRAPSAPPDLRGRRVTVPYGVAIAAVAIALITWRFQ